MLPHATAGPSQLPPDSQTQPPLPAQTDPYEHQLPPLILQPHPQIQIKHHLKLQFHPQSKTWRGGQDSKFGLNGFFGNGYQG
ncbi:hypothetical protein AGOR_G00094090 [Albula goreensis]|uniref:Uncharacterized protein n=1 Tax=Albula goreensis TaxID=1534307 RepID=A0A8T3DK06_9TELE|nr:hypothetical protein AGOR_G00094090 [Albula goreensis]